MKRQKAVRSRHHPLSRDGARHPFEVDGGLTFRTVAPRTIPLSRAEELAAIERAPKTVLPAYRPRSSGMAADSIVLSDDEP